MLRIDYIEGDELPYRVEFDDIFGAGKTEKGAIMAALSVGGYIPKGCRDPKKAGWHLFWNYIFNTDMIILLQKLAK